MKKMTITRKQKWEVEQLYGHFKQLISNIAHRKMWTWLIKGNLKRETESLQIAVQNNAIRTNHIKARIDKTQQNSRCRLHGNRDKIINHIICECSKLAQKEYKTGHDWQGTGNCTRYQNSTIRTNCICTTQNPSRKKRHMNSSGILKYKQII